MAAGVKKATLRYFVFASLRIEITVPDELTTSVVDTILHSSQTGQIGDAKIFVSPIDQVLRIRTGETGDNAV